MDVPPVGSLVVPAPTYRDTMGTGEGAAVLMGLRRGSANLYYAASDRAYWVPTGKIRPIPPEAVPDDCRERLLSDLLLFLEADECVIDAADSDGMVLSIEAPAQSRERLRELESMLGERLADFEIAPGSMRALNLHLDLVSLPAASGAGT
jgi:hypothetical protein